MLMFYLLILPNADQKKKERMYMWSISDILTSPTYEEQKNSPTKVHKIELKKKREEERNRTIRNK